MDDDMYSACILQISALDDKFSTLHHVCPSGTGHWVKAKTRFLEPERRLWPKNQIWSQQKRYSNQDHLEVHAHQNGKGKKLTTCKHTDSHAAVLKKQTAFKTFGVEVSRYHLQYGYFSITQCKLFWIRASTQLDKLWNHPFISCPATTHEQFTFQNGPLPKTETKYCNVINYMSYLHVSSMTYFATVLWFRASRPAQK